MSVILHRGHRLLLACLLNPFILLSQDFAVRYLDIGQGLSNNSVMNIYQDAQGYMWFGTYDGLNRYNGYDFEIYRNSIGDTNSLLSNSIYCITGDTENNLLVGGQIGVSVFNAARSKFSRLWYKPAGKRDTEPVADIVHHIKALNNKSLLVGSHNLGLLLFKKGAAHPGEQVPLPVSGKTTCRYNVSAIEAASEGAWVFIDKKGLFFFDTRTSELKLVNTQLSQAICIKKDNSDRLWLGTNDGLFCLDIKTGVLTSGFLPPRRSVVNILVEKQGDLLLGTDGAGVWQLPKEAAQANPLKNPGATPLVKSNAVWSIFEDKDGRKWFATLRGGISIMESAAKLFTHVKDNKAANPADNFILSFCEDKIGNVWIGTDGAGLRYWNRKNNSFSTIPAATQISSNFITSIVYDEKEDLWISTWLGGINRMKKGAGTIEHFACYNPVTKQQEPNIWLLYKDSHKNIWASATNQGCLYFFDQQQQKFQLFDSSVKDIQSMIETRDGDLWAGDYNTLMQIDPVSRKRKTFAIGYPVRSLLEDKAGRLWVGTQEGGLLLFDRKTGNYKRFTLKEGMPGNTVLRLLEDKQGALWMSSYNGLSKLDPEKKIFQNFSLSDGLQSNQFSFNAGLALSSGEFLFGGINGFNIFSPATLSSQGPSLVPLLSGIAVNNNPVAGGNTNTIRLPFEQANLSLDFVALNYSGSDKVNYAYLLEGWDKDWNYVGKSRRANYARLREGHYTFKVKTSDDGGRWSAATNLLEIDILPPWYRTWWAYLLYFMAATGLLYCYIIYARRQERLRYEVRLAHLEGEKEKELAERQLSVFTNIAHEFRSPLTLIINPLNKAISKNDTDGSTLQPGDLAAAHRNARRLLSLVDQLLLFRKTDSGAYQLQITKVDLVALCNDVFLCFKNMAREKGLNYNFYSPATPVFAAVDAEKLEIAVFNLVANAFKFTPDGGAVDISLSAENGKVTISVSDTGPGITRADQERIFEKFGQGNARTPGKTGFGIGLYLTRHFVEKHGGTISCISEPGNGAVFTITLPLKLNTIEQAVNDPYTTPAKTELVGELMAQGLVTAAPVAASTRPVNTVVSSRTEGASADEMVTEKRAVLVVDDNEELRTYLQRLFSGSYLVYSSSNGNDALQLAKQKMPDLIVSDIAMEGMNGLELCRHIKETEELSHIPVILLTASTGNDTKLQGISGGADDFITKPFDSDILLARTATLLKSRSQLRKYYLNSITLREHSLKVPAEDQEFLKQCIQLVEIGIGKDDFNIKSFAKSMGMSHSALYTRIKTLSGQTVNAFIRSIKLRRAAVLMLTENMNVTEAGFQVGFEDVRYFREQFTKLFGMTPSDYIKKYRNSFNRELNTIRKNDS